MLNLAVDVYMFNPNSMFKMRLYIIFVIKSKIK